MIRNNCNLLSFINCQEKEWGVICRYFHTSTCSTCSIILFQWICSNLHVSHYFSLFLYSRYRIDTHISALDIYLVLRSSPVILPTELNDSTVDETVRKISNLCPMVEYLDYLDGFDINKSLCKLMQQLKKKMKYKYNTYFSFPPLPPAFHVHRPPAARLHGSGGGDLSRRIAATAASCGPAAALSRAWSQYRTVWPNTSILLTIARRVRSGAWNEGPHRGS